MGTEGWRCGRHNGLECGASTSSRVRMMELFVCRHKGLEVCGRGDVEAKSSDGERNAVAHLKLFIPFPSAQQLRMGSFLGRPLRYFVSRREWADGSSGRGGTRVQACAGVGKGSGARRASAARH